LDAPAGIAIVYHALSPSRFPRCGALKADREFVKYLSETGYHPRSSKHGDKLCELLFADLMDECPAFRESVLAKNVSYDLNYSPAGNVPLGWNIDLVIGPSSELVSSSRQEPVRGTPSELWVAVDAKSIMTEHGKARRNRQRDLNSLATILHMKNPKTIVGGIVVINMASSFRSPLRGGETTIHANISRLVGESIRLFEDLPRARSSGPDPSGLNQIDAMGVIVVDYSNIEGDVAKLVTESPAPSVESPVHYSSFVRDICRAFSTRFCAPSQRTPGR
jgi:hypothetical protein